jgi:hypothetical protein
LVWGAYRAWTLSWGWFYGVAKTRRAEALLAAFFADQLQRGLVRTAVWFTDGHLLPYSGEHKVHVSYHTQRCLPAPGQTNLVTCDGRGRVVCFEIQEGKGDLRARILALGAYARSQLPGMLPVQVFDREGDGLGFFAALVGQQTPFVTWEKNADHQRLLALEEQHFTHALRLNGTDYCLLEETKACPYCPEREGEDAEAPPAHRFELRRVVVWHRRTDQRTSVLCWDGGLGLTPEGDRRRHPQSLGCLREYLQAHQGQSPLPLPSGVRGGRERAIGHRQPRDQGARAKDPGHPDAAEPTLQATRQEQAQHQQRRHRARQQPPAAPRRGHRRARG